MHIHLRAMKIDRFVLAIMATIGIAYLVPGPGGKNSPLPLDLISSIGISIIFFFYGLKLSPDKLKQGLSNWKLHLLVQSSTFFLFPMLMVGLFPFFTTEKTQQIWLGFMFLGALPSTVSASVMMVSLAKGNVPAAIFNASISGLIGIAVTPLWMGLFLAPSQGDFDLSSIYIKLLTEILLPVVAGLLLQRWGNVFVMKHQKGLSVMDKSIILLIIYKSFASSFEEKLFFQVNIMDLGLMFLGVIAIFFLVYFLTGFISRKLGFPIEDSITTQFCGTKKSLVHGTVFSKILFPESVSVGIILLPLMLFHAFQIFMTSIIATRLGKRAD